MNHCRHLHSLKMTTTISIGTNLQALNATCSAARFIALPELRLEIYRAILRDQSASGAIVTISASVATNGATVETYQFVVSDEFKGLLLANKAILDEFRNEAAKVYGTNDFETNDKNENFAVKTIRFNQQTLDVRNPRVFRLDLLAGKGFTNLLRHAVLNTALRRIECRVKFIDRFGNTFPGQFSLSWSDNTANKSRKRSPNGAEIWAKACAYVENQIRRTLHDVHNNMHRGAVSQELPDHQSLFLAIVADDNGYDPFEIEN